MIDCSNRLHRNRTKNEESQAEYLQKLVPQGTHVVKAFNVLSAHALDNGGTIQSLEVLLASDDFHSKNTVSNIVRLMGYSPRDEGALRSAREIEDRPHRLFPNWRLPLLISVVIFVVVFLINFGRSYLCHGDKLGWSDGQNIDYTTTVNKTCDTVAIYLLSLCYLPGNIAGYIQLFRGTKFSRFPSWLDRWLRCRKELGLLMLYSASTHVLYYLLMYSSAGKSGMEVPVFDIEEEKIDYDHTKQLLVWRGKLGYNKHFYFVRQTNHRA